MATRDDSVIFDQYYKRVYETPDNDIIRFDINQFSYDAPIRTEGSRFFTSNVNSVFSVHKIIKDSGRFNHTISEKCLTQVEYGTIVHDYTEPNTTTSWTDGIAEFHSVGYKNADKFDLWILVNLKGFRDYVADYPGGPLNGVRWKGRKGMSEFIRVPIMSVIFERPEIVQALQFSRRGLDVLIGQYRNWIAGYDSMEVYQQNENLDVAKARKTITSYIKLKAPWIMVLDDCT
jgi:hypothetical protein